MRKAMCISLAFMLARSPVYGSLPAVGMSAQQPTTTRSKPTLKEQVAATKPGTRIEVRLLNKEKLRGRMGTISEEGFLIQIGRGKKTQERTVAFDEVQSIERNSAIMARNLAIIAVVGGIVIGAFAIVCAKTLVCTGQ